MKHFPQRLACAVILLVLVITSVTFGHARAVTSQELQQQIDSLAQQNAQTKNAVNDLQVKANDYQDAINKLQDQINTIQASINANQAKQADLQKQIEAAEQELLKQKGILAENIKAVYLEGQITTLEMLASSKDLSEFVDKQQYRNSVQDKIKTTLEKITELKHSLGEQKSQVEDLLKSEKDQQGQLDNDRAGQASLLGYNQQQQADFNQQIKNNSAKKADLERQQRALNAQGATRVYISGSEAGGNCDNGSGNGGYPSASGSRGNVCNAAKDSIYDWAMDSLGIAIENRECTSYAFWYFIRVEGNSDFRASGNAGDWAWTSNYGRSVTTPAVGALGIKTDSQAGHVMIVQALPGQTYGGQTVPAGRVLVSEMNSGLDGKFGYSFRDISTLTFIHSRH